MQRVKLKTKHKRGRRKIKIASFFVAIFMVAVFLYYVKIVCPIVVDLSREKVHSLATTAISEVVGDVLIEDGISYADLVSVTYSSGNKVELIEVDSVQVNLLIRKVTEKVQSRFDNLSKNGIKIALGTFTGIPFLYGLGPDVAVQLVPVGTIKTKLDSTFNSAGINQTRHRLNFVVSASIGMVLPANTQNINTELEIMLCESIIVGEIPNVYLQNGLI